MPPRRKSIARLDIRLKKISDEILEARNPAEAARALKIPERTYRNWLSGKAPWTPELLVFQQHGVNLHWLLTGDGPMMLADAVPAPVVTVVRSRDLPPGAPGCLMAVPILDDPVAAGEPRAIRDSHAEDTAVVHRRWCPNPGASVMVRIEGDSMVPTIPDGSLVLVDTADRDPVALIGHPVLLRHGDGATAKRLYRCNRDLWIGVPDNLTDENRLLVLHPEEGDAIIGRIRSIHAEAK